MAVTALLAGSAVAAPALSAESAGTAVSSDRFGGGFTVASLNTLGASHTGAHGNKHGWASGRVRTARAVRLLAAHGVDVVGLQEFQQPQARRFGQLAGSRYALFHAPGDTENSVAWRRDRFALVSGHTLAIPYFNGHQRRMPVVRLRVRATGQELYVVSVHNPADTRRYRHQQRWRTIATGREIALVHRLGATGLPVLVTGDMNERSHYFCRLTGATDMHSAFGGSQGSPCRPPGYHGIDWIFGNKLAQFGAPVVDRSAAVRRTTDHPMVLAQVRYAPTATPGPLTPR